MMPDQAQGSCMALEDSTALGVIFHKNFRLDYSLEDGLALYERLRKPRASRVQAASAMARENVAERIGFSTPTDRPGKLTIEEICTYSVLDHFKQLAEEQCEECLT